MNKQKLLRSFSVLLVVFLFVLAIGTPVTAKDNKVVFGSNYTLYSGEKLNGDLLVLGGNVIINNNATVKGDVAIFGGNADIAGEIKGSLVVFGGNVNLKESSKISGDFSIIGGKVNRSPGAMISGDSVYKDDIKIPNLNVIDKIKDEINDEGIIIHDHRSSRTWFDRVIDFTTSVVFFFVKLLVLTLIAFITTLLFEKHVVAGATQLPINMLASFGIGLLALIAFPIIILFLTITVILIPLALVVLLIWGVLFLFGWVLIGCEVGQRLTKAMKVSWSTALTTAFGTFTLAFVSNLVSQVIPCIGWIPGLIITTVGLGVAVNYMLGTVQKNPSIKNTLSGSTQVPYGTDIPQEKVNPQSSEMDRQIKSQVTEVEKKEEPVQPTPDLPMSEPAPEQPKDDDEPQNDLKRGVGSSFLDSLHQDIHKDEPPADGNSGDGTN
ncbi:MAG: hypothetical protein GX933_00890 [Chloroflexi bacterium]|nr:hypothetical protein [Chloroflexota bacterium]